MQLWGWDRIVSQTTFIRRVFGLLFAYGEAQGRWWRFRLGSNSLWWARRGGHGFWHGWWNSSPSRFPYDIQIFGLFLHAVRLALVGRWRCRRHKHKHGCRGNKRIAFILVLPVAVLLRGRETSSCIPVVAPIPICCCYRPASIAALCLLALFPGIGHCIVNS